MADLLIAYVEDSLVERSQSIVVSSESTEYPATGLYDRSPGVAFQFGAHESPNTILVDLQQAINGSLDAATSSGEFTGWTENGVVARSTTIHSTSGYAALIQPINGNLQQYITVRPSEPLTISLWVQCQSTADQAAIFVQDEQTAKWLTSGGAWTTAVNVAGFVSGTTSYTQVSVSTTALPYSEVQVNKPRISLLLSHNAGATSAGVLFDDVEVIPAWDFVSVHGHNITPAWNVKVQSSPSNAGSSTFTDRTTMARSDLARPAFWKRLTSPLTARYVQLHIDGGLTSVPLMYVGELVIVMAHELQPFDYGSGRDTVLPQVRPHLETGEIRPYALATRANVSLDLPFSNWNSTQQGAAAEVVERSRSGVLPLVIVPQEDEAPVHFGHLEPTWAERRELTDLTPMSWRFVESPFPSIISTGAA